MKTFLQGWRWVERLMCKAGLAGLSPRLAGKGFARRDPAAALATDLARRDFTASVPNRLRVTDLTMAPTGEGPLWLSAIRDAFSRRVVAWEPPPAFHAPYVGGLFGDRSTPSKHRLGSSLARPTGGG